MVLNFFLTFFYSLASFLCLWRLKLIWRGNPGFFFILFQWILGVGMFPIADLSRFSDRLYCFLYFWALLSFALGQGLFTTKAPLMEKVAGFSSRPVEMDSQASQLITFLIAATSVGICFFYYNKIGYNLSVSPSAGSDTYLFRTMRLATYSGEDYYAPGYVNQFKNVLLPISVATLGVWLWARRKNKCLLACYSAFAGIVCSYFLLGTGQRAPFVYAVLAILFGLTNLWLVRVSGILATAAILFAVFGALSYYNGHLEGIGFGATFENIYYRLFVVDQQEGLWGFRHVLNINSYPFEDWVLGILGILPTHEGSPLSHHLYSLMHGTSRGTSSLTTIGSVYHNGGIFFFPCFYLALGIFYSKVYARFLSGRKTALRSMAYGGFSFLLSSFVVGTPVGLLNKGALAYILLLLVRRFRWRPVQQ